MPLLRVFPNQETLRVIEMLSQIEKFLRGNLANDFSGFSVENLDDHLIHRIQIRIDFEFQT